MADLEPNSGLITRRQALRCLGGLAGLAALAPLGVGAEPSGQRTRIIPSSGERLPVVGLGTARVFNVGADPRARAPLLEVMRRFVEHGGRVVDSSPMYGAAEQVVGDLARKLRMGDQLFYATKVWTTGREAGMAQMETSFRLMQTQVMDLMQVHNLVDTQTHLQTIRDWMEQGRIRYVGITHYTASAFDQLEQLLQEEKLDYVQFPYSIANRDAERRLIPMAADLDVAVIAHRNFEAGALFRKVRGKQLPAWAGEFDCHSWGNFFLKYVIADARVTNVIPATSKPKHLVDNMRAGLGRLPDETTRRRMVRLIEDL